MTNQELYDLMDRFERSTLHSLKLSNGAFNIELTREPGHTPSVSHSLSAPASESESPQPEEDLTIKAPLVGTFYAAPAPDQPPYVQVGDHVHKGQTLCLVEAMKMMNEIPAPCDCTIEAVLKEDGTLAAFQEPLFRYRTV